MGLAEKYLPHYTYEDWLRWEGRWELIEGHPIAMSPMPLPEHQRVAAELKTELVIALRKSRCKDYKVYDPLDYKLSDYTILVPDVLIVCGSIEKNYLDFAPALVIEVLSKSTEVRDRNVKFDLYQHEGVKYYLIADTKQRTIEVNELVNGQFRLQDNMNSFNFKLDEHFSISPALNNVWE